MEELILTSIKFHKYFVYAMVLVAILNLFFIFTNKEFSKKVKLINPIYYMFLAAVIFTGVLILGAYQFYMSHSVMLMIIVWLVIFIMSMKLFKIYKYGTNVHYRAFAKKKYMLDIVLIVVTIGATHMVK
ncbi:hypothetical protein [Sulfurospirillum arcachonense]|uniref:hypothetical protein n=1 Tax=Sulfurospirillum arcachonense TaxID=57666 RepID=UPI0004688ED5|nr:hypothetical protein [Sulfurospirillum arcachonense]